MQTRLSGLLNQTVVSDVKEGALAPPARDAESLLSLRTDPGHLQTRADHGRRWDQRPDEAVRFWRRRGCALQLEHHLLALPARTIRTTVGCRREAVRRSRSRGTARARAAYNRRMRRTGLLIAVVAATALVATTAPAKEGVRATLDAPVDLDTPAGKTVRVAWRLSDGDGHPFGAGGIYLRVSRCEAKPLRVRARERGNGRYSARFKVPEGGSRKLMVGLKGWRIIGERKERADAIFNFVPALGRPCS